MELLVAIVASLLILVVVFVGWQVAKIVTRTCPSCATSGASDWPDGPTDPEPRPGDVKTISPLVPEGVRPLWCPDCGHRWRVVKF